MPQNKRQSVFLSGITGSKGACVGKAYVFRKRIEVKRKPVTDKQIAREIERLEKAMELTSKDIINSRNKAREKHGEKYAAIFDSHLLMLEDPHFKPDMIEKLKTEKVNIESIVRDTVDKLQARFSKIEDPYLRERAIDIKDVGGRLLRHLLGLEGPAREIGKDPYVLVAQEVTPSEILDFAKGKLQGVCLDSGGATSHVAILSAALGIPSVFGLSNLSLVARTGDNVLIDTRKACRVVLNPDSEEIDQLNASLKIKAEIMQQVKDTTKDGFKVHLGVNIARCEELPILKKFGLKRIGLFRSEFIFMESMDIPAEKFQYSVYEKVVKAAPEMAVLRTMDIGSDKPLKYLPILHEENPAMGFRSIRFSLSRPEILKAQLRAMLKACKDANARIIFPMISVPEELEQIEKIYTDTAREMNIADPPEWGIMLEVPSAVFMLDKIAQHTRYISLGTNDLQQFFFGVDRTNEKLAGLSDHLRQPFLRFLRQLVVDAQNLGIAIGVCGEMASDPAGLFALIGFGICDLSMRTSAIQLASKMIPEIDAQKAKVFINKIIETDQILDVRKEMLKEFPDLTEFFS